MNRRRTKQILKTEQLKERKRMERLRIEKEYHQKMDYINDEFYSKFTEIGKF